MKNLIRIVTIAFLLIGCSDRFLDEQPNSNIFTPEKPDDFQRLLDNFEYVGVGNVLPQMSADEYYIVTEENWISSRTAVEKSTYIWDKDIYGGEVNIGDWNFPYQTIFYVNNILNKIEENNDLNRLDKSLSDIYGQAMFHRANAYYDLLSNFSVPFDAKTQSTDLGIPLRNDASVDYTVGRSTVQECYDLIFSDLSKSLDFLQYSQPIEQRNRPTRLAAYGLLSRIHLNRREYGQAEKWADVFLEKYNKVNDYNTLSESSIYPFSTAHDELIMYGKTNVYNNARCNNTTQTVFVDSTLINFYDDNDLRLSIYFKELVQGKYIMKAGYNGITLSPFTGVAVDEIMLIKAECLARKNEIKKAADLMNLLLIKRYRTGTYVPITFPNQEVALEFVLLERRKELIWRCRRWEDIKRLNKEGANIVLKRVIGNKEYTLEPNSPRYVFNIPQDEINRSGIEQNNR